MSDKQEVKITQTIKIIFTVIVSAATIVGLYHGLNQYIDSRIQSKISNPSFLRELATSVRPSVVFDENESIVADSGAMNHLEKISVTKGDKGIFKIIVKPKKYIGVEPVVEPLDDAYAIKAERGSEYDWVFQLSSMKVATFGAPKERRPERFRLEIIQ